MTIPPPDAWTAALSQISRRAGTVDLLSQWPAESIADLATCGAMAWALPAQFGGREMDPIELHHRYEQLCGACLTTALVFTQRDAAVSFLAASPTPLAEKLLHEMAAAKTFITIGISQLTTSRKNALLATPTPGGFLLNGVIPWVTSLHHNHRVIVGAVVEPDLQILAALDVQSPGIHLGEPLQLAALTGSDTGEMRLTNVLVKTADILRQPCENALAGRDRGFPLTTCILPLGLADAAITHAEELAKSAPALAAVAKLRAQHQQLRTEIYRIGTTDPDSIQTHGPSLRASANSLANRASLAALELAKGHGLLLGQTAQRRAREAMFFFVWSSPLAIIEETLGILARE